MKGGTAVANVIDFAKKALQSGEHRTIVWTGYGGGAGKTISCAEILKRDFTLHQVTRLCYKTYVPLIFQQYMTTFHSFFLLLLLFFLVVEMRNSGIQ